MQKHISSDVRRALKEDIGDGDRTASLIPDDMQAEASVITREAAVICGIGWFTTVFKQVDPNVKIEWLVSDGDKVSEEQTLCRMTGLARSLVTAERAALNFLQTLSGTATLANRYAVRVQGTNTKIRDTRKTLPGLRQAQKYAVRTGGCVNHRIGLYDGVLIKENHLANELAVKDAVKIAQRDHGDVPIEVEVETIEQLDEAILAGANLVLLDNFSIPLLNKAVVLNRNYKRTNQSTAELEASGGITLENVRAVADTGVDYIAIGAITKDLQSIDLSMRFSQI